MRIVTWNVAGIRSRITNVTEFLKRYKVEFLCLQEVKCDESKFPFDEFEAIGYKIILNSQPQYNGVAIVYKEGNYKVDRIKSPDILKADGRFLTVKILQNKKELYLSNLYAPNGNPINSDKYSNKISWLRALLKYSKELASNNTANILAGDFNIIRTSNDAANIEKWKNDALFALRPRAFLNRIISYGYHDISNLCCIDPEYTFWDYRGRAWEKNDGIRIDLMLFSSPALNYLKGMYTFSEARGWEKPSDHVPVITLLEM